jgi:hypothetical protein
MIKIKKKFNIMKNNLTTFFSAICLVLLINVAAAAQTVTVSKKRLINR